MIQLTEQEAMELLSDLHVVSYNQYIKFNEKDLSYMIEQLKEKGFIKKSKLEKAREKISDIKLNAVESRIVDLYEEAIKEIMEDNK